MISLNKLIDLHNKIMEIITHPFNDNIGKNSIRKETKYLILGSFPAHQVTKKNQLDMPRLNFYYGSSDNKFWDLFKELKHKNLELDEISILNYLAEINFGIIDIIRQCYRKNDTSSSDEDLSIIAMEDMVKILSETSISTIYSTSSFVTKLLLNQLKPIIEEKSKAIKIIEKDGFEYKEIFLQQEIFKVARNLKIITLYSPSNNSIRGLTKGLNNSKKEISAYQLRTNQYITFL